MYMYVLGVNHKERKKSNGAVGAADRYGVVAWAVVRHAPSMVQKIMKYIYMYNYLVLR